MTPELIVASTLITLLGLPHGALDPWVAWRMKVFRTARGCLGFLVGYLALCALGLGGWYLSPLTSLTIFLGYSAVHFGRDQESACVWGGLPYGLIILGAPALFHPNEVTEMYRLLTGDELSAELVYLGFGGVILGATALIANKSRTTRWLWCELGALMIIAACLSPLWYFICFFCVLHSPRHLLSELRYSTPRQRKVALGIMSIITALTVVITLAIGASIQVKIESATAFTYQAIFIGLSVLTIPHMCLMEWERRQKAKERLTTLCDQPTAHLIS